MESKGENSFYHFKQLWLVSGEELMEITSNLFSMNMFFCLSFFSELFFQSFQSFKGFKSQRNI